MGFKRTFSKFSIKLWPLAVEHNSLIPLGWVWFIVVGRKLSLFLLLHEVFQSPAKEAEVFKSPLLTGFQALFWAHCFNAFTFNHTQKKLLLASSKKMTNVHIIRNEMR